MQSYIVTWEDGAGSKRSNQVYAPDRDSAIWRLALLMQTSRPDLRFVSCEPEVCAGRSPATVVTDP
jgi:hypothetical protein